MSTVGDATLPGMTPPGQKRPYPKYEKKEMTSKWKLDVRVKMGQLGLSSGELSRRIGADKNVIRKMLGPDQTSSKFVIPVCEELNLPLPMIENPDVVPSTFKPPVRSIAEKLEKMNDEELAHWVAIFQKV